MGSTSLRELGIRVGRKRIARLMRSAAIVGVTRRRWIRTTVRDPRARPAPDRVRRCFAAHGPNQLWVADITYIPSAAGFTFLAVVLDVWSRKIVGWSMAPHLRSSLVIEALQRAYQQRCARGVIHHSDQGKPQPSFNESSQRHCYWTDRR
jgi:putative transposase